VKRLPPPLPDPPPLRLDDMPPQAIAHVGDAVHSLCVRSRLLALGPLSQRDLHARSTDAVHAAAQAKTLEFLEPHLFPAEKDVVRRARNAKLGKGGGGTPADRHHATAFEALLGYLYLSGQEERLQQLMDLAANAPRADGGEPDASRSDKTHS
jgi:ribonuclease III family protein